MTDGKKGGKSLHYIIFLICVGLGFFLYENTDNTKKEPATSSPKVVTQTMFGFDLSKYKLQSDVISKNEFLGSILQNNGVSHTKIAELESRARDIYDVRNIRAGKKYHIVRNDTCAETCEAFVYEAAPLKYVVYDLKDSVGIRVVDRPYETCREEVAGEIESSLWNTMVNLGVNPGVIDLMEDALASQVSFYHTKNGDKFKVIYETKNVDGKQVGLGQMLGAYFSNAQGEYYSIFFENDQYGGYYDLEGRPSKKSFLRAPIRTGRISSRYNLRRLHPIKKRRIPHLGTDYAAPRGTKIHAVADGVVTTVAFKRNNGKYVKIKHDDTYSSQYLHMHNFAKGIKPGTRVTQGETIGYVGSTGLATGPHVCFRFWKNGKQIDHLRENFPPAEPMPEADLPRFYEERNAIKEALDQIPVIQNITPAIEMNEKNESQDVI